MLAESLQKVIGDFIRRHDSDAGELVLNAPDCWQVDGRFRLVDGHYRLRNLSLGDEENLCRFGQQLGEHSREMFCPYPWSDAEACTQAFRRAVAQSLKKIDASYLLEHEGNPFGHFFLWKAGGNPLSQRTGLEIPELGVAIADSYQEKGFGGLAVRILQTVAVSLKADAIELTTAATNDAGWQAYQRAGFEYVGMIRIPLEVDVTAADLGHVTATRFRTERHMVYLISTAKRDDVMRFLKGKHA